MKFKSGVSVFGVRPEALLIPQVAEPIWRVLGAEELIVTSVLDGKHSRQSFHYNGLAMDLRTHNLPSDHRRLAVSMLREALTDEYVVLHESEGTPNEHVHVHFRPTR